MSDDGAAAMARIAVEPDGVFDCAAGDTILRAALRAGLGMSYSCNTGSCGNCRFELLDGAVEHARTDPPAWGERDRKRNRWLGCQARPLGDCRIRFRVDPDAVSRHRPVRREGELIATRRVTRDISAFSFRVEGDDGFRPGQYALLFAPGIEGGRPYSMANLPGEGLWEFLVKRVPGGAVTGHLFDAAQPGDRLALDGPYGTAWLREDAPGDLVLLAGGSGLSPIVSVAKGAEAAGMLSGRRLHFLYGARAEADLIDPVAVLGAKLAAECGVTQALSEPGAGWTGARGLLPDVAQALLGAALADCELYFAGPAAMSAPVQMMAHEAGLPPGRVHFDEFY